jgi:hypothetical protein
VFSDEVLNLYYAQNRFYDAETHRFTQEDATKDGTNWYSYCENNPLNYVDPWGLFVHVDMDLASLQAMNASLMEMNASLPAMLENLEFAHVDMDLASLQAMNASLMEMNASLPAMLENLEAVNVSADGVVTAANRAHDTAREFHQIAKSVNEGARKFNEQASNALSIISGASPLLDMAGQAGRDASGVRLSGDLWSADAAARSYYEEIGCAFAAIDWSKVAATGAIILSGAALVTLTVLSAGAFGALAGLAAGMYLGSGTIAAATAIGTAAAYGIAGSIATFALSDAAEVITGGNNPLRDTVFGGNQAAYTNIELIFTGLAVGVGTAASFYPGGSGKTTTGGPDTTEGAGSKNLPKYPGNDPTVPPGEGFEWRGSGNPASGKGNWYNPSTGERWNSDLGHGDPIGPHWDYQPYKNGPEYRMFPDGRIEPK